MIYAKLNVSSVEHPQWIWVELLRQVAEVPFGRFLVRDPKTKQEFAVVGTRLRLEWKQPVVN